MDSNQEFWKARFISQNRKANEWIRSKIEVAGTNPPPLPDNRDMYDVTCIPPDYKRFGGL